MNDFVTKSKFDNVYGRRHSPNDGIIRAAGSARWCAVPTMWARVPLSLSVVLVNVFKKGIVSEFFLNRVT